MSRFARRIQRVHTTSSGGTGGTLYGWQVNATNIGLAALGINGSTLPLYTGSAKPAAGTTISEKKITFSLDLSLGGITIDRCFLQPTSVGQGLPILTTTDNNQFIPVPARTVVQDCEIDGSLLTAQQSAFTTGFMGIGDVLRTYIHGMGTGLNYTNTGDQFDCLVENNYITDMTAWGDPATNGNHSDGFTIRDFTNATRSGRQFIVRNNNIDNVSANATGAVFLQTYAGPINNVYLTGNLMVGDGYTLGLNQLNAPYTNINVNNNRFTSTGFGPAYYQGGPGWASWTENYYNNPSAPPNNKGAAIGP